MQTEYEASPTAASNSVSCVKIEGNSIVITPPGFEWKYPIGLATFENAGALVSMLRHLRTKKWFTPVVQDQFMSALEKAFVKRFGVNFYELGNKQFDWVKAEVK